MEKLFLCYLKCSTCNKAKKWLDEHNIEYELRDIVKDKLTEEELSKIIKMSNLDIKKFFNTTGIKYRELNLKEKLINMNDEDKIKLLATDGKLVKRPIFIYDNNVLIGFKQECYEQII